MARLPPAGILLVVALMSCSARTPGAQSGSGTPNATGSTAGQLATADPAAGAAAASAQAGVRGSTASGSPSPLPSGPAAHNTIPLTVSLNRLCARTGDEMRAVVATLAGAQIALAAAYSDNTLVPDFTYVPKDANTTGTYTWAWVIRPDVPEGDALLTVVVSKEGKGASYNQPFRVARTC